MNINKYFMVALIATSLSTSHSLLTGETSTLLSTAAYGQNTQTNIEYEKALISFHDQKISETIIRLKNILRKSPNHLPSRILLAETHNTQGDGAAAENELKNAEQRGADSSRLLLLFADAYLLQSKYHDIIKTILPGNRDDLTEAKILNFRGRAYLGLRQIAKSDQSFIASIKIKPRFFAPFLGRAQIASYRNKPNQALAHVNTALKFFPSYAPAWIMKAKILKNKKETSQALTAINRAIELSPNHFDARITRAAILIENKQFKMAKADVNIVLKAIPNEPQANYFDAVISINIGNAEDSKESLTRVVDTLQNIPRQILQNNPNYYYLAGLSNFKLGRLNEARAFLRSFLRLSPNNNSAKRILGALELQANDPVAANTILRDSYKTDPENPTIMMLLGQSYLKMGNVTKANRLFEKAVALLPDDSASLTELARGRIAEGSIDDAIKHLLKAKKHNFSSIDIKLLLAKAYMSTKKYDKSLEIVSKLKMQFPKNSYLHQFYASLMGLKGDHTAARISFNKALNLDKNNIQALIQIARMDILSGNFAKATEKLQNKLKEHPKNIILMLELGDLEFRQKNMKQSFYWYNKAYGINSNSFATLKGVVQAHLNLFDVEKAVTTALDYTNQHPRNSAAFEILGDTYIAAKKIDQAINAYKIYAAYAFNRGKALQKLARAQIQNNQIKKATSTLHKALAWNNDLTSVHQMLFTINMRQQNWEEVEKILTEIKRLSSNAPAYNIYAGDYYLVRKDFAKAEEHYKASLQYNHLPRGVMGLVEAYSFAGKNDLALAALEEGFRKNPRNIPLGLSLGSKYQEMGKMALALTHIENLITIYPNDPIVLNNAANIQYDTGKIEAATLTGEKALKILPKHPSILDTIAWIYARSGQPEKALPLLRNALVKDFNSVEIKYHLAITLDMLGRRSEAIRNMAEVVQGDADFKFKKDARNILGRWISQNKK
jgi:putative PEP-CTERM system TPR-repeat lipoprotein